MEHKRPADDGKLAVSLGAASTVPAMRLKMEDLISGRDAMAEAQWSDGDGE